MGDTPGRTQNRGSRGGNLPGGVNPTPGGCEGSDDSHQGRSRASGVTPTSLQTSATDGGLGGASVKEEQPSAKGVVWVQYTEKGKAPVTMKLHGDPFEILAAVEARLFP